MGKYCIVARSNQVLYVHSFSRGLTVRPLVCFHNILWRKDHWQHISMAVLGQDKFEASDVLL